MKKLFIMAALWLGLSNSVNAQELKIGDKVPNFNIGKIINYPKESLKFSDIKARLVILDYWNTSCGPCIASLPHMDSLQKHFGDEILILPLTSEGQEKIRSFWKVNRYAKQTHLPTVVNDTLKKYFPHGGVPYHVWILDGKVFAIPDSYKANKSDIRNVLDGKFENWSINRSNLTSYDLKKPLVKTDQLSDNEFQNQFYSIITKGLTNYNTGRETNNFNDGIRKSTRAIYINHSIPDLYSNALKLTGVFFPLNGMVFLGKVKPNILLEVKDSRRYFSFNNVEESEWLRDNTYCYESILPGKISQQELGKLMLCDLDKFFDVKGRIEKRRKECWAIQMKPGVQKIHNYISEAYKKDIETVDSLRKLASSLAKAGKPDTDDLSLFEKEVSSRQYYERLWSSFCDFQISYDHPPIIDETNYKKPFEITLKLPNPDKKLLTFEYLRNELSNHGLELKKVVREINMFVITENDWRKGEK